MYPERLEDLAEVAVLEKDIAIDVGVAHDRRCEQVRVLGGTDFIEWEPLERHEATEVFPSAEAQGFQFDPFCGRLRVRARFLARRVSWAGGFRRLHSGRAR